MENAYLNIVFTTLKSVDFYLQLLVIGVTVLCSWSTSSFIKSRMYKVSTDEIETLSNKNTFFVGRGTSRLRDFIFPVTNVIFLGVAVAVSEEIFKEKWLVQFVQGLNFLSIVYIAATQVSTNSGVRYFAFFVLSPTIMIYAVGFLDELVSILEGVNINLGNISFTLYALARTVIFGTILFWLGRVSNRKGRDFIRQRQTLTDTTKELVLKAFQIGLFVLIALVIMQIAGIDLTALVVFGGAIGVGLGFGLQQIASNFISGIIILLDRSIAIGDYIELEDGRAGVLRELTMRSATLESYDGKDIMVPNERFITTAFVNWSHAHKKQRYPIVFQVAYDTDLEKLFKILREVASSHPQVLSGDNVPIEERPDAEIQAFKDSGIEILLEFWMEGVDDGRNRVGGDLLFMIYKALQENNIVIPYPQREVVIKQK
ncbi:MAG: mechanosensitive ion channel family protein [Terasakiella sp.]|uniref:mechanosensitive ion channel family protein n=1 Tax=unclassified Terasakiella TaxID=2614952 RepID=UPI003B00C28F